MIEPTDEEVTAFLDEHKWLNPHLAETRKNARLYLIRRRKEEEVRTKLTKLLNEKNVHIEVTGCGCCDSPTLKVIIDGELICDEGNFNFDNLPETK